MGESEDDSLSALAFIVAMGLFGGWVWYSAHKGNALRRLTAEAYARAAAVDLRLARQRIAGGDLESAESRLTRAEDKMNSHRAVGVETTSARTELGELQGRYAEQLKPVRRKRVMARLDREGAEIRP